MVPVPPTFAACGFPNDADRLGIHNAKVRLLVRVDERGHVTSVDVVEDPGYGFAEAAVRCVRQAIFYPALDKNDNPIAGELTLNVKFMR